MQSIILVFFSLVLSQIAFAKSERFFSLGMNTPDLQLTVQDKDGSDGEKGEREIVFEPKVPIVLSFDITIGGFSLGYSKTLEAETGELEFSDYRFSYLLAWIGAELNYTEFEKFKIGETKGFTTILPEEETFRADLVSRFMSASIYLFPLRWNYELDKALEIHHRKKTGAGLGAIFSYGHTDIDTNGGLIPVDWRGEFGSDGGFVSGTMSVASLQAALSGVLALGPFYLSGLYALGSGQQNFDYDTDQANRTGSGIAQKDSLKVALGYSGKVFFTGLRHTMESPLYNFKFMAISVESSVTAVDLGFRF